MAGDKVPLHLVGYSNGGALALKYALDSLSDPKLARPDRLVLLSPMVGITSFARFAGVLGWPAAFPSFAKAAWLDVLPEYNPFKYNSFPVNAARQSSQVVRAVQEEFTSAAESGVLAKLPPVLTFQSVLDATVSTSAVVDSLYRNLPANGSELVLFDVNRRAGVGPMIRPAQANVLASLLPPAPRQFAVTVVGNAAEDAATDEARTVAAGATETQTHGVGPALSQGPVLTVACGAAVPAAGRAVWQRAGPRSENFGVRLGTGGRARPTRDGLYGRTAPREFWVRLGTVAVRGERGALIVGAETLMRASSNPFFDYMLERIEADIPAGSVTLARRRCPGTSSPRSRLAARRWRRSRSRVDGSPE